MDMITIGTGKWKSTFAHVTCPYIPLGQAYLVGENTVTPVFVTPPGDPPPEEIAQRIAVYFKTLALQRKLAMIKCKTE